MYFMKDPSLPSAWQNLDESRPSLVKLPPWWPSDRLAWLRRLLAFRVETALFAAADAAGRPESFQDHLRSCGGGWRLLSVFHPPTTPPIEANPQLSQLRAARCSALLTTLSRAVIGSR